MSSALCPLLRKSVRLQHTLQMFADHCGPKTNHTIRNHLIMDCCNHKGCWALSRQLSTIAARISSSLIQVSTRISSEFLVQGNFKQTQTQSVVHNSSEQLDWRGAPDTWHKIRMHSPEALFTIIRDVSNHVINYAVPDVNSGMDEVLPAGSVLKTCTVRAWDVIDMLGPVALNYKTEAVIAVSSGSVDTIWCASL